MDLGKTLRGFAHHAFIKRFNIYFKDPKVVLALGSSLLT
jgi:hypothetical protein